MATVTIAARSRENGKSYVVQYVDPDTGRKKHHTTFRRRDLAQQEANKQEVLDLGGCGPGDEGAGMIRFHRTKTGVERVHRLMPRTRAALIARLAFLEKRRASRGIAARADHVVGHLDGSRIQDFKSAWSTACRQLGLNNFHFHDNRHTFCSNIIMAGGSLKHAKEMIGHKTLRMTDRYSHLEAARINPIQDSLARHYGSAS